MSACTLISTYGKKEALASIQDAISTYRNSIYMCRKYIRGLVTEGAGHQDESLHAHQNLLKKEVLASIHPCEVFTSACQ